MLQPRLRHDQRAPSAVGLRRATTLLLVALLASCGGREAKLTPPDMSILNLTFVDQNADVVFRVDNTAAVPLDIKSLSFTLAFEGDRFDFAPEFSATVPALGSENLSVALHDTSAPDGRFDYLVEGEVITESGKSLRFDREGRLYPTPGRPGSFR